MADGGFISLYRSILKWEWYDDINTFKLFLHLLLTVNYQDKEWHGITIKRGQRIASFGSLSAETKLSVKSVRTAINHLKTTGEVAHSANPRYSVFTVINYDLYQQMASEVANDGQAKGKLRANKGQQHNKDNKENKENNVNKEYVGQDKPAHTLTFQKPTIEEISLYCSERKNSVDAQRFFDFYESKGWLVGKTKMQDWKASVRTWEKRNCNTQIKQNNKSFAKIEMDSEEEKKAKKNWDRLMQISDEILRGKRDSITGKIIEVEE